MNACWTRLRLHSPIQPKTPDPREYINSLRSNPPNFGELAQTGIIFVNKIRETAGIALPFYKLYSIASTQNSKPERVPTNCLFIRQLKLRSERLSCSAKFNLVAVPSVIKSLVIVGVEKKYPLGGGSGIMHSHTSNPRLDCLIGG